MSELSQPSSNPAANPPAAQAGLPLDMSQLNATYANYFHACVSPREVIFDFGLNSGLRTASGPEPVHVRQRIILPWQTARELLGFLQAIMQREAQARAGAGASGPLSRGVERPPTATTPESQA